MSFGFGFALTAIAKAIFSPRSLFSTGAQGAWYDPSDYTTLFEDAAGTIPITSPLEKPVGLMLDKSKGLALGSELVTNGDFSNGTTGWTLAACWSLSNGKLVKTAGSVGDRFYQTGIAAANTYYEISFDLVVNAGSITGTSQLGGVQFGVSFTTSGRKTVRVLTTSANSLSIFADTAFDGSVDNVSVKQVTGNHATQSTTTSRPTLSARYNLLTYTEKFDDAAWTKANATVTSNATTAPDGTNTADALLEKAETVAHFVSYSSVGNALQNQTFSCYIKPNGRNYCVLYLVQTGAAGYLYAYFDLTGSGSVNSSGKSGVAPNNPTVAIEPAANGFFKCSVTGIAGTSNTTCYVQINPINTVSPIPAGDSYAGDTSKGIYIWGADLRVANDGIGLPAYQRVNTATDYDYAGFPPYLKFDGTDDSMATGSIDFTGTDKMFVAAGVRKLSDAASAILLEYSNDINNYAGTFGMYPQGIGASAAYISGSRGTVYSGSNFATATPFNAPITNVVTSICAISTDKNILRINGTQAASSTADQGTGNYGNYPLYIGRRGGSTLPFNGRLYSLVVCGKLASAAEITATEAWVNQKTRAF